MKIFNAHTHNSEEEFGLYSAHFDDKKINSKYFSIGVHPWYLNQSKKIYKLRETYLKNKEFLVVGEIGLDRLKPHFAKQVEVFKSELECAAALDKPIIIHCVKAYYDIISILKKMNFSQKIIFHDYQANLEITKRLSLLKNVYYSFGMSALKFNKFDSFKLIENNRIFIETDDSNMSIDEVYKQYLKIKDFTPLNLDFLRT